MNKKHKTIVLVSCFVIAVLMILAGTTAALSLANTANKEEDNLSDVGSLDEEENANELSEDTNENKKEETQSESVSQPNATPSSDQNVTYNWANCTVNFGPLILINANFTVSDTYITARRNELINLTVTYGINELNGYNGVPLMEPEAAMHLNQMIVDYESENPGNEMKTVSCYRRYGTSCGRLCAATGTSEHHSGYACDLIDTAYGTTLDTDDYGAHKEWQWLKVNSYKYGFIDRYPLEWAGGPMSQPLNVNENGTTGYYETWHYRYVGVAAATEIATGKYNGGKYDSLEHYLKARGLVKDLRAGTCN